MKDELIVTEGDILYNKKMDKIGKVVVVNNKWGYCRVWYPNWREFEHRNATLGQIFHFATPEEKADFYLYLENHGLTDSWRE